MAELAGSTHALFDMIWNRDMGAIDEGALYLVKFHDMSGKCTLTKTNVPGIEVLRLIQMAESWGESCRYYPTRA